MSYRYQAELWAKTLGIAVMLGLTACSSESAPSCKSRTATEAIRQGVERDLRGMQIYGQGVQVTKVEGSPVEQLQFGISCQAVLDIAGVDLARLNGGESEAPKPAPPFQIKMAYRVDKVDGELVTRWDSSNLFQIIGFAANFKAAEEAGESIPDYIFGRPGK